MSKRTSIPLIACAAIAAGLNARSQNRLVRVVSPPDSVVIPVDLATSSTRVEFEYDPRVARVEVQGFTAPTAITLPATAKALSFSVCGIGSPDVPGARFTMTSEAFDKTGQSIGIEVHQFALGPDTTKPAVRILSPKNDTVIAPGDTIDVDVVGEESKSASTWQAGIRRLTLADPSLNTRTSPETPAANGCNSKHWTLEHHFSYSVPPDQEPGLLTFTAGAEDWARNIGFAPLDLVYLPDGLTGVWTTEARLANQQMEFRYSIRAVFTFTLNPRTGAITCGTTAKPYCGTGRISFLPGRVKEVSGGWCDVSFTPAANVFNVMANGIKAGEELKFLTIQPRANVPNRYRMVCPSGATDHDATGLFPVGSILPEGITIPMPLLRPSAAHAGQTTATKHEALRTGLEVDHKVDLYLPRPRR